MPDDPALAPVRKLDAVALVHELNETANLALELTGRARAGEVGAGYVRLPDGTSGVVTQSDAPLADLRRTAAVLRLARGRGLPVPRYLLIQPVAGGAAIVQERLPGAPAARPDAWPTVRSMVAMLDRFAGLLTDRPDVPVPDLYLLRSGPGFCIHESLERHSPRTRQLLDRVREIGAAAPATMSGDDLVHLDFHTGNVLVDDAGAVTGIVDWDGAARGDRWFGLVPLRWSVAGPGCDPAVGAWLDEVLDRQLAPHLRRLYQAHMSLRMVDWAIRHHTPADVAHWLSFGEACVAEPESRRRR